MKLLEHSLKTMQKYVFQNRLVLFLKMKYFTDLNYLPSKNLCIIGNINSDLDIVKMSIVVTLLDL